MIIHISAWSYNFAKNCLSRHKFGLGKITFSVPAALSSCEKKSLDNLD
jgi:hypothetical protein